MEDTMFRDEDELIKLTIEGILEEYSLEDVLEMNDLTDADVITLLYMDGQLVLPEVKPLEFP